MLPRTTSSILGCIAAVIDTESPSQPNPVVIQTTWISLTAGSRCLKGAFSATISFSPAPAQLGISSSPHRYCYAANSHTAKIDEMGAKGGATCCAAANNVASPESWRERK